MKLKAKVVAVESESLYSDGRQRIRIRFEGGESGFREILVANEGFTIDDELVGELRGRWDELLAQTQVEESVTA